jgi:GDP-L-fucose synthase
LANSTYPVEFLYENIQIQNNLLFASKKYKIKRFIFLGSSCIYPKNSKTPINENQLLSGKLEKTNEAYAIAKITGIKLSEYLFYQNNLDTVCLMPTNVYGVNDNYDIFSSHVIPGMIMKFIDAMKLKKKEVELLGTGRPMREFIFSEDLADAIVFILKTKSKNILKISKSEFPILNVGTGHNVSIKKLAMIIKKILNFNGRIVFNNKYPDGTMKKNLNWSKIKKLGWKPKISLKSGLEKIINYKLNKY